MGLDVGLGGMRVGAAGGEGKDSMERGTFEPKDLLATWKKTVLYPAPARVLAPAALKDAS